MDTFGDVYAVGPDWLRSVDHPTALRRLTVLRRRVYRLVNDINHAIADDPDPPTLEQVLASL